MANTISVKRKDLFNDLWETDAVLVCKKYNISLETLSKACNRYKIPMPSEEDDINKKHGRLTIPQLEEFEVEEFNLPTVRKYRSFIDSHLGSRANTIVVLMALESSADVNNPITVKNIIEFAKQYNLNLDRRTVYTSIETLTDLGYDITSFKLNGTNHYALQNSVLEPIDIKLILDSVALNPLISRKRADDISNKVNTLRGARPYGHDWFWSKESVDAFAYNKSDCTKDEDYYFVLDVLDASLAQSLKISFDYMKYDTHGKFVPYRDKRYVIEPDQLYLENETYYLSGNEDESDDIVTFRVDRIKNITLTDIPYEHGGKRESFIAVGSYYGRNCYDDVKIKCDADFIEKVADDFSEHMSALEFEENEDGTFSFTVFAELHYMAHWAAGTANKCEVIEPKAVRDYVIKILENNKYGV